MTQQTKQHLLRNKSPQYLLNPPPLVLAQHFRMMTTLICLVMWRGMTDSKEPNLNLVMIIMQILRTILSSQYSKIKITTKVYGRNCHFILYNFYYIQCHNLWLQNSVQHCVKDWMTCLKLGQSTRNGARSQRKTSQKAKLNSSKKRVFSLKKRISKESRQPSKSYIALI